VVSLQHVPIPERANETYPSGTLAIITLRGLTFFGLDHDSNTASGERARGNYSGPRKRWVLFKVNSWHLIVPTFSKCPTNTNSCNLKEGATGSNKEGE
jgi:hypothetical protein